MTQLQLAERLNISDKAVSKWESGNGDPSLEMIAALSNLFDCTTDYLIKGETETKSTAKFKAKASVSGLIDRIANGTLTEIERKALDYPLIKDALYYFVQSQRVSAAALQGYFGMGYPRASMMIANLENLGFITKPDVNGRRVVCITEEQYNEIFKDEERLKEIIGDEEQDDSDI